MVKNSRRNRSRKQSSSRRQKGGNSAWQYVAGQVGDGWTQFQNALTLQPGQNLGTQQSNNIVQIGNKNVHHIYLDRNSDEAGCYLVACNEYDKNLHLYRAFTPEYHLEIPRTVQP